MDACNIALWAAPSDDKPAPTPRPADLSPLRPNAPPPLPALPHRRGFPRALSDVALVALAALACAAAPPLCIPLQAGRWTFTQVERIASLAVAIGMARGAVPRLTQVQEDRVCIAATRRLHHLLAIARRTPAGRNLLAWQLCQPQPPEPGP